MVVVVLGDLPLLLPVVVTESLAVLPVFSKFFPTPVAVAFSFLCPQCLPDIYGPDLFELEYMDHLVDQQIEIASGMTPGRGQIDGVEQRERPRAVYLKNQRQDPALRHPNRSIPQHTARIQAPRPGQPRPSRCPSTG